MIVEEARLFATSAHKRQLRKYTGDPYIVHPAAVVEIVKGVWHTDEMLAAAWLHDTVEDTYVIHADIVKYFGHEIAELVEMLTDVSTPGDGNRAARRKIDLEHTAKANHDAATIKLADLIDNSSSILEHDLEFAKIYLKEKKALLHVLQHGDCALWQCANNIVSLSLASLEIE
jgi:(p)ppGpp synthase/HD superfamily hydrolase